ncbi:ArnT family glycosyltransferase [Knoellia sp. LjRoot47]|uniref:ArnT family glycosyltransferase n=1 Tax=Knoellia sp. LjRoot47 TaxID=3342330 RepID=UPI003ED0CAE7
MNAMTFSPGPADADASRPVALSPDRSGDLTARGRRLLRGAPEDPSWARPALLGLLVLTAVLYTWNLTSNGWANSFYSAAVQAGSDSWKAFFYGSSDAGNSITVDKPPAALWVMALSVRLLGLSSFSILLPEVLMGVGTVAVVHATVRRHWGHAAGLVAGAVMALTPVAVLMFRFNNTDALLVLLMALGAWATMRSIEQGSARWMALVGVFIGLGFLTKTLQVLLVVPFFGIAYLVAADTTLRRRVIGAATGVAAMVLSAGWWVAVVELVPASMRPYIGGSQTNSFLELTFGYNGLGRLSGDETGSVGGGNGWGTTGLGRMFSSGIGGQISWLIPSAFILLAVGLWLRGRAPRTDLRRAGYIVWGGWLVVTMLTFSLMAGIFHEYYTVALAPAVAALVGMGSAEAWQRRDSLVGAGALALATGAAAGWGFILLGRTTAYGDWLRVLVLLVGLAAAVGLLLVTRLPRRAVPAVIAGALVAALAGPTAYSLTTVGTSHTGSIVTAGPSTAGTGGPGGRGMPGGGGMPGGTPPQGGFPGGAQGGFPGGAQGGFPGGGMPGAPGTTRGTTPGGTTGGTPGGTGGGMGGLLDASTPSTEVVAALSENASSYRWVAAAVGSQNAAGLQLGTELPVMAIGGFNGSDPSPTLAQFQEYVEQGQIHWFAASGGGMGGRGGGMGGNGTASEISSWVQANFTAVTIDGSTFYDLTSLAGTATSTTTTSSTTVETV